MHGLGGGCALLNRPTEKRAWVGAAGGLRLPALRGNMHGLGGGCASLTRPTVKHAWVVTAGALRLPALR
ncbi:hypothetical protein FZH98_18585 [Cronobacter sakazakii]|nr:hypothetical protein FZH98_18585 [Cronobacter sakazakii]KAB1066404.1 hypothetical protein AUN10_01340 [Cronobacter sakazakii]MCI0322313.1 hypothetical protein [Cronobacter sakazakii]